MSSAATEVRSGGRGAAAVAVAVAACGFVAGVFPVFESDLFWHLASGRWILGHGSLPRFDPFRFTSGGGSWIDHEWLFQVVAVAIHRWAGIDGLIVARAAALAGFALLLHRSARRAGLAPWLAGLIALGATLGVRPRFLMRPEIVTLYGIVLLLGLLDAYRSGFGERRKGFRIGEGAGRGGVPEGFGERGRSTLHISWWLRRVGPLVALVVVWVQFHGEAMLAPPLAFLFLLGAALASRSAGLRRRMCVGCRGGRSWGSRRCWGSHCWSTPTAGG